MDTDGAIYLEGPAMTICSNCSGSGIFHGDPCGWCGGHGRLPHVAASPATEAPAKVLAYRPFKRESGVLARVDENGDELRLHSDDAGRLHPFRWHADPTSHDGWRGPAAYGFTPADFAAMAAAVGEPVLLEKLRVLFPVVHPDVAECDGDDVCGKCGAMFFVDDGMDADPGDPCHSCAAEAYVEARALLNP